MNYKNMEKNMEKKLNNLLSIDDWNPDIVKEGMDTKVYIILKMYGALPNDINVYQNKKSAFDKISSYTGDNVNDDNYNEVIEMYNEECTEADELYFFESTLE